MQWQLSLPKQLKISKWPWSREESQESCLRPHPGGLMVCWQPPLKHSLEPRGFTGLRNPAPSPDKQLPGFSLGSFSQLTNPKADLKAGIPLQSFLGPHIVRHCQSLLEEQGVWGGQSLKRRLAEMRLLAMDIFALFRELVIQLYFSRKS